MPCRSIAIPGGGRAIACSRASRRRKPLRCSCCGLWESQVSMRLCDAPERGGTCDEPVCTDCATHVEPDIDYCQGHRFLATPKEDVYHA